MRTNMVLGICRDRAAALAFASAASTIFVTLDRFETLCAVADRTDKGYTSSWCTQEMTSMQKVHASMITHIIGHGAIRHTRAHHNSPSRIPLRCARALPGSERGHQTMTRPEIGGACSNLSAVNPSIHHGSINFLPDSLVYGVRRPTSHATFSRGIS